jgi:phage-related tail protein
LKRLGNEKLTVLCKDKAVQLFEQRLHKREGQLKQEQQKIQSLQRERFKQRKQLERLQLKEKNLLSDIKNNQVSFFLLRWHC